MVLCSLIWYNVLIWCVLVVVFIGLVLDDFIKWILFSVFFVVLLKLVKVFWCLWLILFVCCMIGNMINKIIGIVKIIIKVIC